MNDYDYEIVTDASADISDAAIQKYSIKFIPMRYTFGDEEKVWSGTGSEEEKHRFYLAERNGAVVKSTQINPESYREFFEPYAKEGKSVLYLCLSGGLSQTFASAVSAAKELAEVYPQSKIICIDSLSATVGLGLLTELAAKNRESGMSPEENAAKIENVKLNLCHWFTVDDLGFLKRGGRIPASLAAIGKMLHIKPIMRIGEDGKLGAIGKKIGLKFAFNELASLYSSHSSKGENEDIRIVHCDCPAFAESVKKAVLKINPSANIEIQTMSPIIGIHVGYDVVGVVHFGTRTK
ncbi:MAG: DegV family protein [Candidatus Borkfalkiaceae bacterium]|nr:DegV family protein [Clostridia bacterium]MDY6223953.1 DegV family protein [Christensenellaceae bacterium]